MAGAEADGGPADAEATGAAPAGGKAPPEPCPAAAEQGTDSGATDGQQSLRRNFAASSRVFHRSKSRLDRLDAEDEELDMEELVRRALSHRLATACTTYDDETGQHCWRPLSTTPLMLGVYGTGVELYFEFLFFLGILFGVMFLVSMPTLITALLGTLIEDFHATREANFLYKLFGYMSIANMGSCPEELCKLPKDVRDRPVMEGGDVRIADITEWLGHLDATALLLFMTFGAWFHHWWIPRTVARQDEAHVTAADFAVRVDGLPRTLGNQQHASYEDLLQEHFVRLLREAGVEEEEAVVEEIALVRDYDGAIHTFMYQGQLLAQKRNAEVAARQAESKGQDGTKHRHLEEDLHKQVLGIEQALEEQGKMFDEEREVCFAFVSFRREAHKNLILHRYRHARAFWFRLFQSRDLRFFKRRIKVVQACEPTDLYWENLDFGPAKRSIRRALTLLLALFIIVLCGIVLVFFRSVETSVDTSVVPSRVWVLQAVGGQASAGGAPCLQLCDWYLSADENCGATSWELSRVVSARGSEWSGAGNASFAHAAFDGNASSCWRSPSCDAPGGGGADWLAVELLDVASVPCMQLRQPAGGSPPWLAVYSCTGNATVGMGTDNSSWRPQDTCTRYMDLQPGQGADSGPMRLQLDRFCGISVPLKAAKIAQEHGEDPVRGAVMSCFCSQQMAKQGSTFRLPPYNTEEKLICYDWSMHQNMKVAYFGLGVVAVLVMNQVLLLIFMYLDAWARYETATDLANSQMLNLFVSQLVNTGLLVFLVSLNFRGTLDGVEFLNALRVGEGVYDDLNRSWFVTVGTGLFVTVVGQVASSLSLPIVWTRIVVPLYVWWFRKGLVTQGPLNSVYTLPDWTLSLRLAETMTIVFCIVMYSGGMPILYLVGAIYCALAYWSDKWTLLRGSRQPPAYTEETIQIISLVLFPLAAAMHVAMTLAFFGQQSLFPSGWSWLHSFVSGIVRMDKEEYSQVMDIYTTAGTNVQEKYYFDYVRARFLDCSRQACWSLLLICFCFLASYALSVLSSALRPCCTSLEVMLSDWGCKCIWRDWFEAEDTVETYTEALARAAESKLVFSYKLAANPRYQQAAEALTFHPDLPTQLEHGIFHALTGLKSGVEDLAEGAERKLEEAQEYLLDRTEEALRSSAHALEGMQEVVMDRVHDLASAGVQEVTRGVSDTVHAAGDIVDSGVHQLARGVHGVTRLAHSVASTPRLLQRHSHAEHVDEAGEAGQPADGQERAEAREQAGEEEAKEPPPGGAGQATEGPEQEPPPGGAGQAAEGPEQAVTKSNSGTSCPAVSI